MVDDNVIRKDNCLRHEFVPLGFEVINKSKGLVEAIAAITCKNCGMFRTKILTFRREFTPEQRIEK